MIDSDAVKESVFGKEIQVPEVESLVKEAFESSEKQ